MASSVDHQWALTSSYGAKAWDYGSLQRDQNVIAAVA